VTLVGTDEAIKKATLELQEVIVGKPNEKKEKTGTKASPDGGVASIP